MLRVDLCKKH